VRFFRLHGAWRCQSPAMMDPIGSIVSTTSARPNSAIERVQGGAPPSGQDLAKLAHDIWPAGDVRGVVEDRIAEEDNVGHVRGALAKSRGGRCAEEAARRKKKAAAMDRL
jgi:hypothetical protein